MNSPDSDPRRLAEALDRMLDAIARAHSTTREDLGLSALEMRLLRALRHGPATIGDLARTTVSNRSSISMATRRLEERDLLVRTCSGRNTTVTLNPELERQLREACCEPLERGVAVWFAQVTERDPNAPAAVVDLVEQITDAFADAITTRTTRSTSDQLHSALRRGDAETAYSAALALVDGGSTRASHDALTRAMHRIGDDWQVGEIGVADERISTTTCARVLDRLHSLMRSTTGAGADAPRAIVCSAPGNRHELALRMVTHELERQGWHVDLMSGDIPGHDLADMCRRLDIDSVFVGVTLAAQLDDAVEFIRALSPHATVHVGGQALDGDDDAVTRLRAAGASRHLTLDDLADVAPPGSRPRRVA